MHRVVKELEKKKNERKFTFAGDQEIEKAALAKMAAKKKKVENVAFQIECETEAQWKTLLRREGLIVVDVYAGWAGPCSSMISILKRVKVEVNDDKLWLAIANSDNIGDLLMFKDQSEPCWLFIGGGKPVKVVRCANAPKLINTIKSEFEREVLCMQGKQKRNLISIDDEVSRRRKAEAEAMRLVKYIKEEEESTAEDLNAIRQESSVRLIQLMEPYTVLVIQSFLLETGVVTEVRDALQGDFKVEQERLVYLNEDAVRKLFRIPYKILDPNQQNDEEEFGMGEENTAEPESGNADDDEGQESKPVDDESAPQSVVSLKPKKPKIKTITINLPEGLVGDTLFMLLESIDVRKMIASGRMPDRNSVLQTADDFIQLKVGPVILKDAIEHAPYSFHALYGRGVYEPGVWCPRRYDDKRFVMVNYFPRFVTDILVPPPRGEPKYVLAVYPADLAAEITKQVESHKKDVIAEGTVKIPTELADAMAKTWSGVPADVVQAKKNTMATEDVYAISVNRKNSTLMAALQSLDPIHVSFDTGFGKVETKKVFTNLKIDIDNMPNPDEVVEKFLARTRPRYASVTEFTEEEMPKAKLPAEGEGGEGDESQAQSMKPSEAKLASGEEKEPPKEGGEEEGEVGEEGELEETGEEPEGEGEEEDGN